MVFFGLFLDGIEELKISWAENGKGVISPKSLGEVLAILGGCPQHEHPKKQQSCGVRTIYI